MATRAVTTVARRLGALAGIFRIPSEAFIEGGALSESPQMLEILKRDVEPGYRGDYAQVSKAVSALTHLLPGIADRDPNRARLVIMWLDLRFDAAKLRGQYSEVPELLQILDDLSRSDDLEQMELREIHHTRGRIAYLTALRTGDMALARTAEHEYLAARALTSRWSARWRRLSSQVADAVSLLNSQQVSGEEPGEPRYRTGTFVWRRLRFSLVIRLLRITKSPGRHIESLEWLLAQPFWKSSQVRSYAAFQLAWIYRRCYDEAGQLFYVERGTVWVRSSLVDFADEALVRSERSVLLRMLGLHVGRPELVVEAVAEGEVALSLADNPKDRLAVALDLANALKRDFTSGSGEPASLDRAIELFEELDGQSGALEPDDPVALNLSSALTERGRLHASEADLLEAIRVGETAIAQSDHPVAVALAHVNVGNTYRLLGDLRESPDDYARAVMHARVALEGFPPQHRYRGGAVRLLAKAGEGLAIQVDHEDAADAQRLLELTDQVTGLIDAELRKPYSSEDLDGLAMTGIHLASVKHLITKDRLVGEAALKRCNEALSAASDPEAKAEIAELTALVRRAVLLSIDELDQQRLVVELEEQWASANLPAATRWEIGYELATALLDGRTDVPVAHVAAIAAELQHATNASDQKLRLAVVATRLRTLRKPPLRTITASIRYLTHGLELLEESESSSEPALQQLAWLCERRFDRTDHVEDLLQARAFREQALAIAERTAATRPHRANMLASIADNHLQEGVLRSSIDSLRSAVELAESGLKLLDPDDLVSFHSALAGADRLRHVQASAWQRVFTLTGDPDALARSIEAAESTVFGADQVRGVSYAMRYELYGDSSDLERCIEELEGACARHIADDDDEEDGDGDGLGINAIELATALRERWTLRRDPQDLASALDWSTLALELMQEDRDAHHVFAVAASVRFEVAMYEASLTYLQESIDLFDMAIDLPSPWADMNASTSLNAAQAYAALAMNLEGAEADAAFAKARDLSRSALAVTHGSNSHAARVIAARVAIADPRLPDKEWEGTKRTLWNLMTDSANTIHSRSEAGADLVQACADHGEHDELLTVCEVLAPIIHRSVLPGLLPEDRAARLHRYEATFALATAAAIANDDVLLAIRWFTHGRSLLHVHAIKLEAEMARLNAVSPELSEHFRELAEVEIDTDSSILSGTPSDAVPEELRDDSQSAHLATLIQTIRDLPGFDNFMQPLPEITGRLESFIASDTTMVLLNVSSLRCDAILVDSRRSSVVPLSSTDQESLASTISDFNRYIWSDDEGDRKDSDAGTALEYLWSVVAQPIVRAVGLNCSSEVHQLRRLLWCPGSFLAYVPWHAVGAATTGGDTEMVMDYALSSVVASPADIARQPSAGELSLGAMGVAVMPTTPGEADLPGAKEEGEWFVREFGEGCEVLGLAGSRAATRQSTLDLLSRATWVHLACHVRPDPDRPTNSEIVLRDHALQPLTARDVVQVGASNRRGAFIAGCSSSLPSSYLPEQSLHLARAFGLAGFEHVIGNLWNIYDAVACELSIAFYSQLSQEIGFDGRSVAESLHNAIIIQREQWAGHVRAWAGTVHFGYI